DHLEALARAALDPDEFGIPRAERHGRWHYDGSIVGHGAVRIAGAPRTDPASRPDLYTVEPAFGPHIAQWDPAAVLTLCAGARELAEEHRPDDIIGVHCETCQVAYQCQTIRTVARMLGLDPDGDDA